MSIQPIDLQVLFSHMNQVSKDQAVQKDAALMQQATQASDLVKKSEQQEHSIDHTKQMEDGPEKVHDDDRKKEQQTSGEKKHRDEQEPPEEDDILRDPDLGHHIDISG